jgi:hypothetical protein
MSHKDVKQSRVTALKSKNEGEEEIPEALK